jgi:hypothetical protein
MNVEKELVLPRIYDNPHGNYPQHLNKPKLSYSQHSSWTDPKYNPQYRSQYFGGVRDGGNPFSQFGGECGEWLETSGKDSGPMLSERDVEILTSVERHPDAKYEVEIVVDRGSYCIQGFIDYEVLLKGGLDIKDYKTGSIAKKEEFYGSDEYQQTTLYAYQREAEGEQINYSGVTLLDRKGNTFQNIPLALTGEVMEIATPYSKERAEIFLKKMDKVALEISNSYKLFLELSKIK